MAGGPEPQERNAAPTLSTSYMLSFQITAAAMVTCCYYQLGVGVTWAPVTLRPGREPRQATSPRRHGHTLCYNLKKKKNPSISPIPSLPPSPKRGHPSVIPTEARASVAQEGQRVGSPYMVPIKSLTKSGKRFSTMLARTALISRSCSGEGGQQSATSIGETPIPLASPLPTTGPPDRRCCGQ